MANINVTDKATFKAAITSSSAGDTIKCAAGVYDVMCWQGTTTKKLTVAPQGAGEVVFRGLSSGVNTDEGMWKKIPGEAAGSMANVTFDGITFRCLQYTECKATPNGTPQALNIPNDGVGGFGWHIDYTYPGCDGTSQTDNAHMELLVLSGSNTHHNTFQNCLFEQGRCQLKISGAKNNVFQHNDHRHSCEDVIIFGGSGNDGNSFLLNDYREYRPLDYQDAVDFYGAPAGGGHVHADFFQIFSQANVSNLVVDQNYMEDHTGYLHGTYLPNPAFADGNGSRHDGITISRNEWRMMHATGILLGPCNNPTIRGNKIYHFAGGSNTYIQFATGGSDHPGFHPNWFSGTVDISNNVCGNFNPSYQNTGSDQIPADWTLDGNKQINSDGKDYPDNWQPIQKEKVLGILPAGTPYAGRGGGGGTVVVTPGDPLQDADFNMLGCVEDPAFPNDATKRQTGVIEIPSGSIAYAFPDILWGIGAETPITTTYLGTTTGGSKLYRLNAKAGNATYHLATPGNYIGSILVYYKDATGLLSSPSAVSSRFTVPQTSDRSVVHVKPKV